MQTDLYDSSFFNHQSVMTDEIIASIEHYPLIHNNELKGIDATLGGGGHSYHCLLYTSPSPRDRQKSRMPSSA